MVWIVEWSQPGQNDMNVTLWNSKHEALAAAAADIMECVHDWDLTDPDTNARARFISDECAASNWEVAIDLFNEWEGDGDFEYMQHFRVYSRDLNAYTPNVRLLRIPGKTTIPAPPDLDTQDEFKATTPGATCRGPCGSFNEYAYADKADGSYCCYQCKFMSQVFGGKVP